MIVKISKIFKEFYSNRNLFNKEYLLDEDKLNYFKKTYKFMNRVFNKYVKNSDNFCRIYKTDCFTKIRSL